MTRDGSSITWTPRFPSHEGCRGAEKIVKQVCDNTRQKLVNFIKKQKQTCTNLMTLKTRVSSVDNSLSSDFGGVALPQVDGQLEIPDYMDEDGTKVKIALTNARSVHSKLDDVRNLLESAGVNIICITETWEVESHQNAIEDFTSATNTTWLSRKRRGRGGGVAVVVKKSFASAKLVLADEDLEIVWVQLIPLNAPDKPIIVGTFYAPPSSSKSCKGRGLVQDRMVEMTCRLKTQNPNAEFILSGDVNDDDFSDLQSIDGLKDVVTEPTRVTSRISSCLDKIYSTLFHLSTVILNPISSDDDSTTSDHRTPVAEFRLLKKTSGWITYKRRQFAPKCHADFTEYMTGLNWKEFPRNQDVDDMVDQFQNLMHDAVNKFFPLKRIRAKKSDPKWLTDHIRELVSKKKSMYRKFGNSERFRKFKYMVRNKIKEAKATFFQTRISSLRNVNPKKWHKELAALTSGCQQHQEPELHVPELNGMDNYQKAEFMANQIAKITDHYEPIRYDFLRWKYSPHHVNTMRLTVEDVRKRIETQKIPRGQHPDDLPRILIKRYASYLAIPLTFIYNCILRTGCWPKSWKIELTSFIKKGQVVETTSDLRPIALTPHWSKVMESFVRDWINEDIKDNVQLNQFGGCKGSSVSHYISSLFHKLTIASEKGCVASLLMFDYSKAFNSLDHNKVIESAERLGVRPSMITLLVDYLKERNTVVSWLGAKSNPKPVFGGSGQGTLLSVVLFTITVDSLIRRLNSEILKLEPTSALKTEVFMYVDDIALVVYHGDDDYDWTPSGLVLDDGNRLNSYLKIIASFSSEYGMRLNTKKTCTLNFNFTRSPICMDSIRFPDGSGINEVHQAKLLGLVLDNRLKLNDMIDAKYASAMRASWFLRRLNHSGVSQDHIIAMYCSTVRPILEFAMVGVWPMLNWTQKCKLEGVQRKITKFIVGWKSELSYQQRLDRLGLSSLQKRWERQTKQFAQKLPSNPRMKSYFQDRTGEHCMSRRFHRQYQESKYTTERFKNSPINEYIRLLNNHQSP